MVMCARCHKRIAVVFITKMENGQRTSEGLCMRCAKEAGLPVHNMLDGIANQMGFTPDQLASMEDSMNEMMANAPSEQDGNEDGGAPAVDMPSLFGEGGVLGDLMKDMTNMDGENVHHPTSLARPAAAARRKRRTVRKESSSSTSLPIAATSPKVRAAVSWIASWAVSASCPA